MEILEIEELKKELEKLKDLKIYVFEWEVYVKVEDYREKTIENRKLNERIKELEQCNLNLQTWIDNKEKVNKQLRKGIEWYEKEKDRLREENKKLKRDSEELKIWLREKLPLALLKEYMGKFEWVDLKND